MKEKANPGQVNSGDFLELALASYTPVSPRGGLEERVLARLTVSGKASRRPFAFWPWIWGVAGAVAASIVLAAVLHLAPAPAAPQNPVIARREPPATAVQVPGRQEKESALEPDRTMRIDDSDSVALREMRAPSHPVPDAPLTTEEKLLLRIANGEGPKEVSMLNAEIRAGKEADQEEEFQVFAGPSVGEDGH